MTGVPDEGIRGAVRAIAARYPRAEAALLPVLHLLQRRFGAIGPDAEALAAGELGLDPVRVRETVTFYEMLRTRPAGTHLLRVCVNLSCTMAGAEGLLGRIRERLGIGPGETTSDGRFTLIASECLGNCDQAPCIQVDGEDYGPVTADGLDGILAACDAAERGGTP